MVTRYKYSPQFEKVKLNLKNIWSKFFGMIDSTRTWVPIMSTFSIRKRRYIDNPNPLSGNGLRLFFTWKMLLKVLQQQDSFSSWNQCNEIWESLHQSRKATIFERSAIKVRESVSFAYLFYGRIGYDNPDTLFSIYPESPIQYPFQYCHFGTEVPNRWYWSPSWFLLPLKTISLPLSNIYIKFRLSESINNLYFSTF